jgi:hypothetical protein
MKAKKVYEAIDFKRGQAPLKGLDIGLSSEQRFDSISPGDIFKTAVDMPNIRIWKNSYILVLEVKDDGFRHKHIKYVRDKNLETLKKNHRDLRIDYWGWPADFFAECLVKIGHINIESGSKGLRTR